MAGPVECDGNAGAQTLDRIPDQRARGKQRFAHQVADESEPEAPVPEELFWLHRGQAAQHRRLHFISGGRVGLLRRAPNRRQRERHIAQRS
jgi:hypothetical protein